MTKRYNSQKSTAPIFVVIVYLLQDFNRQKHFNLTVQQQLSECIQYSIIDKFVAFFNSVYTYTVHLSVLAKLIRYS